MLAVLPVTNGERTIVCANPGTTRNEKVLRIHKENVKSRFKEREDLDALDDVRHVIHPRQDILIITAAWAGRQE